jgi:hypothetical protein
MPFSVTNTDTSAHKYDADDGKEYTISLRDVYTTVSGLPAGAGAQGDFSTLNHPRGVYIVCVVNNKRKRRFVPVSKAKEAALVAGGVFGTVDGVSWNVAGYRGERHRVKRVVYGNSQ